MKVSHDEVGGNRVAQPPIIDTSDVRARPRRPDPKDATSFREGAPLEEFWPEILEQGEDLIFRGFHRLRPGFAQVKNKCLFTGPVRHATPPTSIPIFPR